MTLVVTVKHVQGEHVVEQVIFPADEEHAHVRLDFNPSEKRDVTVLKGLGAALLESIRASGRDPRLTAIARTAAEESIMWAVKSATKE